MAQQRPYDVLKRGFDVLLAIVLLVLTFPIQLVVAVLVAIKLGRPVFFSQPRPGKDSRVFTLHKFRSMKSVDETQGLVSDEERLTQFGMLLRSTSLDELPTLWNVVRGDMSLVGPRPLLVQYLAQYTNEQARRHEIRPGITGWAQVNGRNAITWEEKFRLDVEYVDSRSLVLDLRIVVKTFSAVIARRGITHAAHVTMTKFGEEDDA